MKNYYLNIIFLGLLITASLCIFGCSDDDDTVNSEEVESILPYDSSKHLYGTFGQLGEGQWQIVIDPMTGQFNKVLASEAIFGGGSDRIGAKELITFDRNERVYIPTEDDSQLRIQSMDDYSSTDILLTDTSLNKAIIFPQILRFGETQHEVYILDTDKSLWKTNLDSKEVVKIHKGIPISNDNITNLFLIDATGNFLCSINEGAVNDYTSDGLIVFDSQAPDSTAIISATTISSGFGFVQSTINENNFYYIQRPLDDKGFRLMRIQVNGNEINVLQMSNTDLPIDNLSPYLQTIHSASNTYIIRGGSSDIDSPSNILYSIDLDNGELVNEVEFEEVGMLLKLAGE